MANITITVPDAAVNRIQDAFALEYGWTPDTGLTKNQWIKFQLVKFIKQTVKNNEGNTAAGSARITIENDVEAISIT